MRVCAAFGEFLGLRAGWGRGQYCWGSTETSGGALAGATVTVTDTQRGVTRTLTADAAGQYSAPNLTPGTYTVRAEFKGFQALERQNILIQVGTQVRVDLSLQPGEQTQTVTVTESVPLVQTTNAVLGGALNNELISDLPLNRPQL